MKIRPQKTAWPAVHGGIFLTAWLLTTLCWPILLWPWYLLLPLSVYACIAFCFSPLRRTVPRLSAGRLTGARVLAATGLSVLTAIALLLFQYLEGPDISVCAAAIPVAVFGNIVLAGTVFSVINAILEELIFRGLLYGTVAAEWTNGFAVAVTAALFAACHLNGYPPGPFGAMMALLYGIALALMRWWCNGLALTIACHISADATIFYILATAGGFSGMSD